MSCNNPLSLDAFHEMYPEIDVEGKYVWNLGKLQVGGYVRSNRGHYRKLNIVWRVVSVGRGNSVFNHAVLLECSSNNTSTSSTLDRYWSYGRNELGQHVVRRIMFSNNLEHVELDEEEKETMCSCRRGHCYCDTAALEYEVNEHSSTIDITKGYRRIRLSLEECAELASFLGSAKTKIKEAKLANLKEQQDELAKQLKEVEAM
jgi:hypothetical protein